MQLHCPTTLWHLEKSSICLTFVSLARWPIDSLVLFAGVWQQLVVRRRDAGVVLLADPHTDLDVLRHRHLIPSRGVDAGKVLSDRTTSRVMQSGSKLHAAYGGALQEECSMCLKCIKSVWNSILPCHMGTAKKRALTPTKFDDIGFYVR